MLTFQYLSATILNSPFEKDLRWKLILYVHIWLRWHLQYLDIQSPTGRCLWPCKRETLLPFTSSIEPFLVPFCHFIRSHVLPFSFVCPLGPCPKSRWNPNRLHQMHNLQPLSLLVGQEQPSIDKCSTNCSSLIATFLNIHL